MSSFLWRILSGFVFVRQKRCQTIDDGHINYLDAACFSVSVGLHVA